MQFRHRMLDVGCIVRRYVIHVMDHRAQSIVTLLGHRGKPEDTVVIEFEEPQKGVAPGQVAALWDGTWCLGCGVIESTI